MNIETKINPINKTLEAAQAQCSDKTKILLDLMMAARLQNYINIAGVQDLQFNAVPLGFFTKAGQGTPTQLREGFNKKKKRSVEFSTLEFFSKGKSVDFLEPFPN